MVISGTSVSRLVSRICCPAMLNMLPKLALVAMKLEGVGEGHPAFLHPLNQDLQIFFQ